ncbi:hypothetical protein ADU37_CDS07890 [Thermococcus sp. 2319x1]|uniref:tetratricopeptide repeat protein n=1 Tax=Thermococcus sp. 2319x1 TaxID=1674923 RepID=UPI00073A9AFD|nr:tetratricopeptide repeat protein [Thermococcus sp. 2319x1]ALV62488.1 hypothetical protein ADU37_CDS07890 [Thermococcus sp. 2319x1]
MVEIEDIVFLVRNGKYEEALKLLNNLDNNLDKVLALSAMAKVIYPQDMEMAYGFLEDAEYFSEKIKDKGEKAKALANIASAYYKIGDTEYALELFEEAIKEAEKIKKPEDRIYPLANIAYYMGISELVDFSLDLFERVFDIVVNLRVNYVRKTEYLIELGNIMENVGDELPSEEAIKFYERAHDLFEKLRVPAKAATIERKIDLARIMATVGLPEIRKAVSEGKYIYATKLIIRTFNDEKMFIGLLEVALWMKKNETLGYSHIVETALKYLQEIQISNHYLHYVIKLLTELERFEEALKLSMNIEDVELRSEIMAEISVGMLKSGEIEGAFKIAELIPDIHIRAATVAELRKILKY